MALRTTGTMTTDEVEAELGKTSFNTHGAEELALIGISSGTVEFPDDFYGKSSVFIGFDNIDIIASTSVSFGTAESKYFIKRDGTWSTQGDIDPLGTWADPTSSTIGDGYEVAATKLNGSTALGMTSGTWYALTTTRSLSLVQAVDGNRSCQYRIDVREAGTTTVLATQTVNLLSNRGFGGPGGDL